MKPIAHFLVAGALLVGGVGCSTSNTGSGTTSGAGMGPGSGSEAASGTPATTAPPADMGVGSVAATDVPAGVIPVFMSTFATMGDPVFLINVASSNLLGNQAAQQAAQQATSPDVKRFAQIMGAYHSQTDEELKKLAPPLNVVLPTTMLPVHQALFDRMLNKTGKDFDEAYMDLMERAHTLDIAMFEVKSKGAETPAVKSFAARTLPVLRSHRTLSGKLEKRVD